MFENIMNFFKKMMKKEQQTSNSKDTAKERLHLVLMQDRANVSADFLDLMKQEIIEVIKKYIEVDESAIDVRLTNKENEDGTNGAPALYANIPIINIKDETRKQSKVNTIKKLEENKSEDIVKEEKEEQKEQEVSKQNSEENKEEKENKPQEENKNEESSANNEAQTNINNVDKKEDENSEAKAETENKDEIAKN